MPNNELPLISIIIPVYNRAEVFQNALTSAVAQTYENTEVIVVDDGSEPAISNFEFRISNSDNITYLRQENKGAPAARNRGFQESKGEYVIFWDADMVGESDMLQKMFNTLNKNTEASFCYSNFYFGTKKMAAQPFDIDTLKKQNYIVTTSLIRREDFPEFDEHLKRFQDWDLWLTMAEQGKRGVWLDEYLFNVISTGIISDWLPSCAYRSPWRYLPWWRKKLIIISKHKK